MGLGDRERMVLGLGTTGFRASDGVAVNADECAAEALPSFEQLVLRVRDLEVRLAVMDDRRFAQSERLGELQERVADLSRRLDARQNADAGQYVWRKRVEEVQTELVLLREEILRIHAPFQVPGDDRDFCEECSAYPAGVWSVLGEQVEEPVLLRVWPCPSVKAVQR